MERAAKKKQMRWVGMGLVGGAFVAIAIWIGWPSERLLMAVARPIIKISVKKAGLSDLGAEKTYWLAVNQLLIVTSDQENATGQNRPNQSGVPQEKAWQGSADLLNTTSHTRSHLPALTHLIERITPGALWWPDSFEMSPDGRWLLWQRNGNSVSRFCAAYPDGTHYREWECGRHEERFFLDARHLVQMQDDAPTMIHDLLDPANDQTCSKPEQVNAVLAQYATQQPTYTCIPASQYAYAFGNSDVAIVNSGPVVIATYRTQDRMQLRLAAGSQHQKAPTPLQIKKVQLPRGATLLEVEISPKHTAIYYKLRISGNPLSVWVHRLIPRLDPLESKEIESLWVSRIDGQGMHEIGHVPHTTDEDYDGWPLDSFRDLVWLPDGKQISFTYHDTLYVVPAESEK